MHVDVATHVATAIERLLQSRTEHDSNDAYNHLENTLIVQGGLQACAPFSVPILVQLLECEMHESARVQVYEILYELATGVASLDAFTQFSFRTSPFVHIVPDDHAPVIYIELVTRMQVISGLEKYALDAVSSNDSVRSGAISLIETFSGYGGLVRRTLTPYANNLNPASLVRSEIFRLINSAR